MFDLGNPSAALTRRIEEINPIPQLALTFHQEFDINLFGNIESSGAIGTTIHFVSVSFIFS